MEQEETELQIRIHGPGGRPTLIYLPGIHGDWTLVSSFRSQVRDTVRFVEFTYPRTLTWSLDDYAGHILDALREHGIDRGVLLGESFGSQLVWPLLNRTKPLTEAEFTTEAVMLSGGFVRYPHMRLVDLSSWCGKRFPMQMARTFLGGYARFARFRHRNAPETLEAIREFVERRTELDRKAMVHRLHLIRTNDPRPIASNTHLPLFHLSGVWDPVVNWHAVRKWLRIHCPGYRETRLIRMGDHNVLGTAPAQSARIVLDWMNRAERVSKKKDPAH